MAYELMELSTGNLVGIYPSEASALADVLESIESAGEDAVETLALGYVEAGASRLIAQGPDLVHLARRHSAVRA